MVTVAYGGASIERCSHCRGMWFPASGLENLLNTKGAQSIDVGDPEVGRKMDAIDGIGCPSGHVPKMIRMVDPDQTHIWYERCPVCGGTWLDAGEFSDLKHDTIADFFRDLFRRERR